MFNKLLDIIMPWATGFGTFCVWFIKQFGFGLKAILDNLVVMAVIIPLIAGTWGYTRHLDKKIINERQHTIDQLVSQVKCMRAKRCK